MRKSVLVFSIAIAPANAPAQVKLEATPFFTSYYATNLTARPSADTTERQEAGPGLGFNVTYHFNNMFGVQGTFAYVFSGIIPKYPSSSGLVSNSLQALPGRLTFVTVRGTLQPRRSNYYVAAGIGAVQRSGTAWDVPGLDRLTNVAGSLGYGIRARVTPEFAFNIGVDLQLYVSDPDGPEQPSGAGHYYQRRLQRDVLVSIGVPYAVVGK